MISPRETAALHATALAHLLATAEGSLSPEHMRYADNGWWIGLSINA